MVHGLGPWGGSMDPGPCFVYVRIHRPNCEGVWKTRKSGIRNPECGTRTGQINEYFKLGSMIGINTPLPFSVIPRKMDDDTRSPFKKRHEYKEPSSYHSSRSN